MELIFVVAVGVVMGSDEEDATVLGVVCGVVIIVGDELGTLGNDGKLKKFLKGSKRVGKECGGLNLDWKGLFASAGGEEEDKNV